MSLLQLQHSWELNVQLLYGKHTSPVVWGLFLKTENSYLVFMKGNPGTGC